MLKVVKSSLVFVCCIYLSKSQAPYLPNGYRPSGPRFDLPRNFGDNSNLQPETQYGTPAVKPPPNEYVPGSTFPGSRLNHFSKQQNDLQLQSQYGTPKLNPPPQQYLPSDPSSDGRFDNFDRHQPNLQPLPSQNYPRVPSSQGTLNNLERHENNFRELTKPQIKNLKETSQTEVRSGRQNYLPPNPTKRTRQQGYPEQTTKRPRKQEEPTEEQDSGNPNVAFSTAVANGRYYLYQPNAVLQRVTSKVNQKEDPKSNEFSAQIIYQNVNPLSSPFYTPIIAI